VVEAADSCSFNGQTVTHGSSVTAYLSESVNVSESVEYGRDCLSQTRFCTDGSLSGTYEYSSCIVTGSPENSSCVIEFDSANLSINLGQILRIKWKTYAYDSNQIYLAIFSGWGTRYYFYKVIENSGSYDWISGDLDPDLDYDIYLESAEFGVRTTQCWKYKSFDIIE
jgi:hypothetical protein